MNISGMAYAWCLMFSAEWFLDAYFFKESGGMIKEIALALFVTAVAFCMIFLLDKLEDHDFKSYPHIDEVLDPAINAIIKSISVLIGFSWERAFDEAVKTMSEAQSIEEKVPKEYRSLSA